MKYKELKNRSEKELQQLLKEEREHLRELRFDLASKKLKKVREVRESKKTIAMILTLINKKMGSGAASEKVTDGEKKEVSLK